MKLFGDYVRSIWPEAGLFTIIFFVAKNNCSQANIQELCKQFISFYTNFHAKKLTNTNLKLNFNLIYILDIIWEPMLNLKNYADSDLIFKQSKINKNFDEK
jgi:hypothetical protein